MGDARRQGAQQRLAAAIERHAALAAAHGDLGQPGGKDRADTRRAILDFYSRFEDIAAFDQRRAGFADPSLIEPLSQAGVPP